MVERMNYLIGYEKEKVEDMKQLGDKQYAFSFCIKKGAEKDHRSNSVVNLLKDAQEIQKETVKGTVKCFSLRKFLNEEARKYGVTLLVSFEGFEEEKYPAKQEEIDSRTILVHEDLTKSGIVKMNSIIHVKVKVH